ncbi:hypothetical protein NM688_g1501 [Phlebia brevispora]|uniref:Uncharacterized protein n=1 Tax=Phlebia brevispora TaxID=194682 RepID=A0ACC1TB58_9APHY|nr:hypothetical protein NM688_g1501 [Phlebia brevispora]
MKRVLSHRREELASFIARLKHPIQSLLQPEETGIHSSRATCITPRTFVHKQPQATPTSYGKDRRAELFPML